MDYGSKYRLFVQAQGPGGYSAQASADADTPAEPVVEPPPAPAPDMGTLRANAGDDRAWTAWRNPFNNAISFYHTNITPTATGGAGGYTYAWALVGSPAGVVLNQVGDVAYLSVPPSQRVAVTVRVTVTDSAGATATDTVRVTV